MTRFFRHIAETFTSFFNISNGQLCKCIKRNKITCIQRIVFYKPSRWIRGHSLNHNLVWYVMWAFVFSFTFFQLLFRKNPNSFYNCYSLCSDKFFLFFFSCQVCSIFSLMDFCLACVTGRIQFTFKSL